MAVIIEKFLMRYQPRLEPYNGRGGPHVRKKLGGWWLFKKKQYTEVDTPQRFQVKKHLKNGIWEVTFFIFCRELEYWAPN